MLEQYHLLYVTAIEDNVSRMRRITTGTGIEILSTADLSINVHVRAKSLDPMENARLKAKAYYKKSGVPTLAVESGLYIDGLPEEEQPAAQYRKFRGIRLTDRDCIDYYSTLSSRLGGQVKAMFLSAACLVLTDDLVCERCDGSVSAQPFLLSAKAHPKQISGQPFASLAVKLEDGRYWADDLDAVVDWNMTNGYRDFFAQALKQLADYSHR